MKQKLKNMTKKLGMMLMTAMLYVGVMQNYVYAAGIGNNKLFTGTKKLFSDMKTPLIGLSAIIGVVMIVYYLIRMKMSDEMDEKMYKKRIFIVIACCVGVVLISSLLTAILSYYK